MLADIAAFDGCPALRARYLMRYYGMNETEAAEVANSVAPLAFEEGV